MGMFVLIMISFIIGLLVSKIIYRREKKYQIVVKDDLSEIDIFPVDVRGIKVEKEMRD